MFQIIALYRQGNTGNNFLLRLRQTYSGLLVSHILIKILLVPNLKKPGSHAEFSPTAYLQRRGRERAKDVEMVARKRLCVFLNFAGLTITLLGARNFSWLEANQIQQWNLSVWNLLHTSRRERVPVFNRCKPQFLSQADLRAFVGQVASRQMLFAPSWQAPVTPPHLCQYMFSFRSVQLFPCRLLLHHQ